MDGLNVLKISWLIIGEKKYGIDIPTIIAGIILIKKMIRIWLRYMFKTFEFFAPNDFMIAIFLVFLII